MLNRKSHLGALDVDFTEFGTQRAVFFEVTLLKYYRVGV